MAKSWQNHRAREKSSDSSKKAWRKGRREAHSA